MSKNKADKDEMMCFVLKLKNELYDGTHYEKNYGWHGGAHEMLNRVINRLDEYRY